jgi:hypothetical protein
MGDFSNELLHRLRSLQQALADLVAKYRTMHDEHPERPALARMIQELELEITLRRG